MDQTLTQYVIKNVEPDKVFSSVCEWPRRPPKDGEVRVPCIFHDDNSPSLYCNITTGAWYCHGCEAAGKSIVSFWSRVAECSHDEAALELFREHVRPIISRSRVKKWNKHFHGTPTAITHMQRTRRVSVEVCDRYMVGFDGNRFTLPVENEFGHVVNIKLYDPLGKKRGMPKMLNWSDSPDDDHKYGSPTMLFPMAVMDEIRAEGEDTVFITEGELDALALLSVGVMAVSPTAGVKSWPSQYNHLFRGLHVVVCYDNDSEGARFSKLPIEQLASHAKSIRRIVVKIGKDPTDWIFRSAEARTPDAWFDLANEAEVVSESTLDDLNEESEDVIPLTDTITSRAVDGEPWKTVAHVKARTTAVRAVPSRWSATCAKTCETCPLRESATGYIEGSLDPDSDNIVQLALAQASSQRREMLGRCKIKSVPTCHGRVTPLEHMMVHEVVTTERPEERDLGTDVTTTGYVLGAPVQANTNYLMSGRTVLTDRNLVVHQFTSGVPVVDSIDTFALEPETVEELHRRYPGSDDAFDDLLDMAQWSSTNVTRIYDRQDLHVWVDLVFHSVPSFWFRGELVRRGMLDVMVVGDTRCGKGFVAERLSSWYNLGQVASGENASVAGLIGGVSKIGGDFYTTWGIIPYNHRRLVVVDEAGGLGGTEWSALSRVRSEGVAEITKIIRDSAQANTRLLWLANPPRPMGSYTFGIQAITDIVPLAEDIARFDLVGVVAAGDVELSTIHQVDHMEQSADAFSPDISRALLLWIWSLTADDITFTPAAEDRVLELIESSEYTNDIPVMLAQSGRFKLAKIAAAVAARLFSTDENASGLMVTRRHVDAAWDVVRMTYDKPTSGLDRLSEAMKFNRKMTEAVFTRAGPHAEALARGLLIHGDIHDNVMLRYIPDRDLAGMAFGELINAHALMLQSPKRHVTKHPEFTAFLHERYPTHDR